MRYVVDHEEKLVSYVSPRDTGEHVRIEVESSYSQNSSLALLVVRQFTAETNSANAGSRIALY